MSLLEITGLSLDINGTAVLRDVSLHMDAGEVLAITGESGSGKSMTALSVLQLLPPGSEMSGDVRLDGACLSQMSEPELCEVRGNAIGMVFQEPMTALNPVHTIGDQVAETIRLHRHANASQAKAQAAQVLERVGLPPDDFPLSRYPHELSGGQRQRVVIAMAIACGPKLLIADEPTTALDVTTQAQILDLVVKLAREDGMGLLIITHDLAVVAEIADRIAVMRAGEIVETGPTMQVLQDQNHAYTRQLFAASTYQASLPPQKTAKEALLVVRGVTRSYKLPRKTLFAPPRRFEAVRDVSFELSQGERLGLVGESGCGKSTLTRAILGLEPVQAGQIEIAGVPVTPHSTQNRAARQHCQVVFQDPFGSFNPRHKVGRLIAEPFHLRATAPAGNVRQEAIAKALTDAGLHASDSESYIHEFSGGQRQRIAIARALIIEPELIIFDEAVSALDVSVRARVLDLLADICHRRSLSYLFISHDLSVVRSVTDRVLVMKRGEIVEQGATEQVFTNPQHPYTKMLLAAAPSLPTALARKGQLEHG